MPDKVTLTLTLTVRYLPNGVDTTKLAHLLENVAHHAANNGLLTGETDAEVDCWDCDVSGGGKTSAQESGK